jgi:predicted nucleic acid binding AN1-type Zn finger protein
MSEPTKCATCKAKLSLLQFPCKHCSHTHCTYHRLPETHNCTGITTMIQKDKEAFKAKMEQSRCVRAKI